VVGAKASFKCPYGGAEASFSRTWSFSEVDRYAEFYEKTVSKMYILEGDTDNWIW